MATSTEEVAQRPSAQECVCVLKQWQREHFSDMSKCPNSNETFIATAKATVRRVAGELRMVQLSASDNASLPDSARTLFFLYHFNAYFVRRSTLCLFKSNALFAPQRRV